jgi:putative ABC transport system permease protein
MGLAEEFILESLIKTFYMDEFVFESISDLPEIEKATYHIYLQTLSAGCCSIDEGQVIAFNPETDFVISPWLKEGPPKLNPSEVYVGSYVYDYLGLINTASLFGQGVKVVGHLQETGTGLDRGIFMRMDDLKKVTQQTIGDYKDGKISIIFMKVKKGVNPENVVAKIRNINPRLGILTRGSIGSDIRATLNDILKVFSITILISSLLSILLAWSTFTALTNERRREVGILRAIGALRSHIYKLFLTEALIISLLGGLLGVAVGHYLIRYLSSGFQLINRLGAVSTPDAWNLLISMTGIGVGVLVCMIGAAIPISRLARMDPLHAIKLD